MKIVSWVFIGLVLLFVLVDVLWLNGRVVELQQVGRIVADRLVKIDEQINFLAFQQEQPSVTAASTQDKTEIEQESTGKTTAVVAPVKTVSSVTSEVFIPLGSGSSSSIEWVDTGAQAYVDTTVYPRLQETYLQASLKANSGVVYARLLQKNEGGVIGTSEISHNTPTSNFRTSGAFGLSPGNKLYAVQIRSENGQEVFLENARLRLVLR